jgi:transcriptional regulator GlxA family with amidase domain
MERQNPDRVRQHLTLLTATLDEKLGAEDAARKLNLSHRCLNWLVQAVVSERPPVPCLGRRGLAGQTRL